MKTDDSKKLAGTLRPERTKESNIKDLLLTRVQPLPAYAKDSISDKQYDIYRHTTKLLIDAQVITKLDIMVILRYAVALDVYLNATELLNQNKAVQIFGKTGASNVSGFFTAWKQAGDEVSKMGKLLGLDPYIRERIAAYAKQSGIEEESPFDKFYKEMNELRE